MSRDRKERVKRLKAALERKGSPRAEMAVIALCTGASGFLFSSGLLRLGLERMWLRYLLALLLAYCVFFCLVRLWLHLHARKLRAVEVPDSVDGLPDLGLPEFPGGGGVGGGFSGGGGQFGGGGASALVDGPRIAASSAGGSKSARGPGLDFLDADEVVLPIVLVAALAGALLASGWVVYSAPSLLAELLVDGALVGGLYRRLRRAPSGSWLAIALRGTALPFLGTCLLFVFAGWFIQSRLPAARSMGDAVRHLQSQRQGPAGDPIGAANGLPAR